MSLVQKTKKILYTTFNIKRVLGFVWSSSRGWAIVNAALLLVQGVLPIVSIYLLKLLVDSVATAVDVGAHESVAYNVYTVLAAFAVVMLLTGLSRTVGNLVNKEESRRIVDYMHDVIHKKAVDVDLEYYENPNYQDSLHRAQEEAAFRPGIIVRALTTILQNTISLAGVAWLLLVFKWQVLFLLICAVVPEMIVRFVFSSREYLNERNYTKKERRAAYYHWMLVGRDLAKETRLFRLGDTFIKRFRALRTELRKIRFSLDKKSTMYSFLAHMFSTLLVFTAYFWIARDALLGLVTIGSFVMFYQAFQKGQMFLQSLLEGIASLYENNLFLTNLYEFLDYSNSIKVVPGNFALDSQTETTNSANCRLVVDNVFFTYPSSSSKQVLKGVKMVVEPGEVAALVGLNGSGKTTLVKLVSRLYDVTHGSIYIDDTNIQAIRPYELRKKIGVIFQDYVHFNLSARDNIWFGDIDKPYDSSFIPKASVQAGADEMIKNLPQGYDTVLGRMFERGEELSEGQWQKIALARAFFRDTQMVILDEPTSSMDPKSEYELFNSIRSILNGRTALLISHRMSTVRMADKIFVMNDGKIVEKGTHEQLLSDGGIYADLFETQASSYLSIKVP